MPRVRWGIDAAVVDEFDRDSQYTPYSGPTPPNGVYEWIIKVLKYVPASRTKHPQLRIGLELLPREARKDERQYSGYFVMVFRSITPDGKNAFSYVPFCDAIGVSGREFTERTIADQDGNVKKIGSWRNDGKEVIQAQLIDRDDWNGAARKDLGWMGPLLEEDTDDEYEDDEEIADEDEEGDEPF